MAVTLGPIQLVVIGLDNDKLKGQVSREIHRATEQGSIRVLDALAVQKTQDGAIVSLGASDLTPEQRMMYGAVVGGLLGLGATGTEEGMNVGAEKGAELFADQNFGLSADDVRAIAADIPAGKTVLLVLFEHRWAIPVKRAIEDAGGVLMAQGMVRPETLIALGTTFTDAIAAPPMGEMPPSAQPH
jgi:uncharacterized membrane protein